jgi:Flp pilus assembly protein TadD
MSLINEMLNDLEERGGSGRASGVRATAHARASGTARALVGVLALLVVLLGATIAWLLQPASSASVPAEPVVTLQEAPSLPQRDAAPAEKSLPLPADGVAESMNSPAIESPVQTVEDIAPPAVNALSDDDATSTSKPDVVDATPVPEEQPANSVIVRRHEPTAAEKAARAGRDGHAALRLGDWTTAARLLGELVALEPANDEAREGLAVALASQGRIAESDGVLLDGIAVGAAPARFAKLRARLQAARGDLGAALDSLSIAVPAAANDPEFHALKAALAQQAGHHETAAEIYRVLTALDPANGTWQAGLGMAFDGLGDSDGARAAYAHASAAGELDPALRAHVERRLAALKSD